MYVQLVGYNLSVSHRHHVCTFNFQTVSHADFVGMDVLYRWARLRQNVMWILLAWDRVGLVAKSEDKQCFFFLF